MFRPRRSVITRSSVVVDGGQALHTESWRTQMPGSFRDGSESLGSCGMRPLDGPISPGGEPERKLTTEELQKRMPPAQRAMRWKMGEALMSLRFNPAPRRKSAGL